MKILPRRRTFDRAFFAKIGNGFWPLVDQYLFKTVNTWINIFNFKVNVFKVNNGDAKLRQIHK